MATPKKEMMEKINSYLTKFANKWGVEKDFVVAEGKEGRIELRTDSFIYEQIYDPSISEIPSLMKQAEQEFGAKRKPVNAYSDQEKFGTFLRENGWDYELEGGGILTIYNRKKVWGEDKPSYSCGGMVRRTGYAKVHKGELVIPRRTVDSVLKTNRGQGGYFRHRKEHSINRRKAHKRR